MVLPTLLSTQICHVSLLNIPLVLVGLLQIHRWRPRVNLFVIDLETRHHHHLGLVILPLQLAGGSPHMIIISGVARVVLGYPVGSSSSSSNLMAAVKLPQLLLVNRSRVDSTNPLNRRLIRTVYQLIDPPASLSARCWASRSQDSLINGGLID